MWGDDAVTDVDASALRLPVLIVHGTADAILPAEVSRALAQRIADVEIPELEGAGHVPTMTRANEVAEAIQRRFA
jgi:pimeloyl-ACP methyl ester carboxylesterase